MLRWGNVLSVLGDLAVVDLAKAMAALRRLWTEALARSGNDSGVPPRGAFTPELLKPWLTHIVIVEAVAGAEDRPRFRVRLAGSSAVAFGGRDLTGMFLDEAVAPGQYDITIAPYLKAIATATPVEDDVLRDQFLGVNGTRLPVRRLVMPCTSNGRNIDRFVVGLFLYRPESQ